MCVCVCVFGVTLSDYLPYNRGVNSAQEESGEAEDAANERTVCHKVGVRSLRETYTLTPTH